MKEKKSIDTNLNLKEVTIIKKEDNELDFGCKKIIYYEGGEIDLGEYIQIEKENNND